jgi:hypothetical protein
MPSPSFHRILCTNTPQTVISELVLSFDPQLQVPTYDIFFNRSLNACPIDIPAGHCGASSVGVWVIIGLDASMYCDDSDAGFYIAVF